MRRRSPVLSSLFLTTVACGGSTEAAPPPAPVAEVPAPREVAPEPPERTKTKAPRKRRPIDRVVATAPGTCVVVYATDCRDDPANCPAETHGKEAIDCPPSLANQVGERQLVVRRDSCEAKVIDACPPQARCNPPRPETVECPERYQPRYDKQPDGTCVRFDPVQCPVTCDGCPPVPTCNPPPPRVVDCPEGL